MRYMVIENFKAGRSSDIYRRFAERGRMLPGGLRYLDSWVSSDLRVCYQLMETDNVDLFATWTREWDDLIEFEIVPIIPSDEARAKTLQSS